MIRIANYADIDAIARVHVQSWIESYQGMIRPAILDAHDFAKCQQIWQYVMKDCHHQVWVYAEGDHIQGFIDVYLIPNQKIAEIKALYLLKKRQGQGIGTAMLQLAFTHCKAFDYHQVQLDVFDRNPSCLFYEKLGAKKTDQSDASDYANGLNIICYQWLI